MSWRNRVEVSYGVLRANIAALRRAAGDQALIAVVKADAYGLGLERCARIYHESGVAALAVANVREADRVRASVPGARIILLSSPLPEERPAVVASGYDVCLSSSDEVHEFGHLASPRAPQPVHVFVDTGMGRFGAVPSEAERLLTLVAATPSLRLVGIGSHYPMADHAEFSAHQETLVARVVASAGPLPPHVWIHVQNSEGLMLRPSGPANAVRVGILMTGVVPDGCPDPGVFPAVRWVSSLTLTKVLPRGHGISYNRSRILERDSLVGIVPVGYADGLPIALSNKGSILVQGRRCPILGRVTMDYLIVDLTDLPTPPAPGEAVVIFGNQGDETITINEMARLAGTIPYDILCGLRGRCEVVGVP